MNNKAFKYIKYLSYLLFAGGFVVLAYFVAMSIINPEQSMEFQSSVGSAQGTEVMLKFTYILLTVAVVVALIFPLINIVKNPKGSMRTLLGLLLLVIVLGIGYLLSSAEPIPNSGGGFFENPGTLRLTDTGLYATYIMLVVAFAVILFGEIKNAIKK